MKPEIEATKFGSITIAGQKYPHDVIIRLDGRVEQRPKELSKAIYGTSHIISLQEAQSLYETGAERLIIGSGQVGMVKLSPEAAAFLQERRCEIEILPTPQAIRRWNQTGGRVIALFHVTC